MKPGVTTRNLEVLQAMADYRRQVGLWPTLTEVGDHLGIHRVTVHEHLLNLKKLGLVRQSKKHCSRSWSVVFSACERIPELRIVSPSDTPRTGTRA